MQDSGAVAISAVVITLNEEREIEECLKHLQWADEIIVLDSYSSDKTVEIAMRYTDKVFQRKFDSFEAQRNYSFSLTNGEWILFIDADERITEALASEIKSAISSNSYIQGFYLRRENYFLGFPSKYVWGDDFIIRLVKREKGVFTGKVHEKIKINGKMGELKNPLLHYNSRSLTQYIRKNNLYTTIEAETKYRKEGFSLMKMFLSPIRVFLFRFINKKGFKDGAIGFLISSLFAFFVFQIHFKMLRLCLKDILKKQK